MKAKISRGGGIKGLLAYAFEGDKRDSAHGADAKAARVIGGTCSGLTPAAIAREIGATRKIRPDIARPAWHCSLSLPPPENLTDEKWGELTEKFMEKMGFSSETVWTAVRHHDTEHDHVHIIASRIDLAGKLFLGKWEAKEAIKLTNELAREYDLREVDYEKPKLSRRQLKKSEIDMAIRTDEAPPRLKIQQTIDAIIARSPISASHFAEQLEAAGIRVRANLASTGKMNGFSFALNGVQFTGSSLGAGYKWTELQKKGVTYDKDADAQSLSRFRYAAPATGDNGLSGIDRVATGDSWDAGRSEGVDRTGGDLPEPGAIGGQDGGSEPRREPSDAGGLPGGTSGTTGGHRGLGGRVGETDRGGERSKQVEGSSANPRPVGDPAQQLGRIRTEPSRDGTGVDSSAFGQPDGGGGRGQKGPSELERSGGHLGDSGAGIGHPAREDADRSRPTGASSKQDSEERNSAIFRPHVSDVHEQLSGGGATSWGRAVSHKNWRDRFKKPAGSGSGAASPARPLRRFTDTEISQAREIDPTAYLEVSGYTVKREGLHLSVRQGGEEVYRVTRQHDGHWVACTKTTAPVGDNAALVQEIEGCTFVEAIHRLIGTTAQNPAQRPTPEPPRTPPKIPTETPHSREAGRRYLQTVRKISLQTVSEAESAGFLKYVDGGVVFVGYGQHWAENAIRRATNPADEIQKRDFAGSDKWYPPILAGNPGTVWIVEGGVDALAVHDLSRRAGKSPPTVIVSGGSKVRLFFENPDVQAILKSARRVVVAFENEKDAETQAKTDAEHRRQAEAIQAITGREPQLWSPPEAKDLAEFNEKQQKEAEIAEKAAKIDIFEELRNAKTSVDAVQAWQDWREIGGEHSDLKTSVDAVDFWKKFKEEQPEEWPVHADDYYDGPDMR